MSTVYVPSYCFKNKYTVDNLELDFGSEVIGVFDTEKKAVNALIALLVSERVIGDNFRIKTFEDEDEEDACFLYDYSHTKLNLLTDKLIECIDDFDSLEKYCYEFNDSCYEDKWYIKMDVFNVK